MEENNSRLQSSITAMFPILRDAPFSSGRLGTRL